MHTTPVEVHATYLDTLIRIQVRDQDLNNLIAIRGHDFSQGILDFKGKFFLGFKDGIELQIRQLRTDDIIDMGRNLLRRIRQGIESYSSGINRSISFSRCRVVYMSRQNSSRTFVHLVAEDLVLYRDDTSNEDIV